MGSAGTCVGLTVFLWLGALQSLVSGVLDYWDDPAHLLCRSYHMQFVLPNLLDDAVFSLTVLDGHGKSHYLRNNSDCGIWVGDDSNGSVVVGTAYNGCFVREEDGYFVMTIVLQEVLRTKHFQYHKKDLKCPVLPAMDAPSDSECAAINQVDRIPCGNASVSRDLCQSADCCYNPSDRIAPCYFGNRLTAQCNDDAHIVVVLSKDLTLPPLLLHLVKMVDVDQASCPELTIQRTLSFVGFRFPLSCSKVVRGYDGGIAYENTFFADKEMLTWQGSSITRDSTISVTVRCSYSSSDSVPVQIEVNTLPPPPPVSTTGPLVLEMRIAQDEQYKAYYANADYPVTKVLREPVFLEVRILQRTDPELVLVLNNCWATSSVNPTDGLQWPVLFNGCAFVGDNYLTELTAVGSQDVEFPSHYQRFTVSTFTFVSPTTNMALDGLVFFHCSASVCVPSATESCKVNCANRKRRMVADVVPGESLMVTSDGPVMFIANEETLTNKELTMEEGDLISADSRSWLIGTAGVGCVLAVILVTINLFKKQQMSTVIA